MKQLLKNFSANSVGYLRGGYGYNSSELDLDTMTMTIKVHINHTTCYYDFLRRFAKAYHSKLKVVFAISGIAVCVQDKFLGWLEKNKEKISNYKDVINWILEDKKTRLEERKKTSAISYRRNKLINNEKIDDKYKIPVSILEFLNINSQFEKIEKIDSYDFLREEDIKKLSDEKLKYLLKLCRREDIKNKAKREIAERKMSLVF
jgi:hypothetical protein